MVIAETIAGLGALKTAFDMAKALENIHETTVRDRAVIDLQKEILVALSAQSALMESEGALKKEVAALKAWDADKKRYELCEVGPGVLAYTMKHGMENGQPFHLLCTNCYDRGIKSVIQSTQELQAGKRMHLCPHCKTKIPLGAVTRSAPTIASGTDFDPFTGR